MKTVFKKIEETVQLVSEVPNEHEGACIILATPDAQDENAQPLCFINGMGVNIIDTIAGALVSNKSLKVLIKDALALVEGQETMVKLAKAKMELMAENKAKESYAGESVQPNTACDSDEETCDSGEETCDSGEERGPEQE